jgi:hypothetical protein
MATVYNYEDLKGPLYTNGVNLVSSTTNAAVRLLFNAPVIALTNTAFTTATFVNTAGAGLSSGAGTIVYDNAYNNRPAYLILTDRTSFATTMLSAVNGGPTTATLSANGFNAWGPTERRLRVLEYI